MKVNRFYLEIKSLKSLNEVICPNEELILEKVSPPNIEINKFFYKNIGKKHRWVDRLIWDNLKWVSYIENKNVYTYILKLKDDLVGYFEIINDENSKSTEIAYFGILENFIGKKTNTKLTDVNFNQGLTDQSNKGLDRRLNIHVNLDNPEERDLIGM